MLGECSEIIDVLPGVILNLKHQYLDRTNDKPASVDIDVLPGSPWSKRAVNLFDSHHIKYNYNLITNDEKFEKISNITSINSFL